MVKPETIRKVELLRAYLATLKEYTTPTLNVDTPVRGGVHGVGSRLSAIGRLLMPDVILCLDRSECVPIFVMVVPTKETFAATLEGIDAWLQAHAEITLQQEIDEALHVLTRAASRLGDPSGTSTAHKALNVVRKTLTQREAAA